MTFKLFILLALLSFIICFLTPPVWIRKTKASGFVGKRPLPFYIPMSIAKGLGWVSSFRGCIICKPLPFNSEVLKKRPTPPHSHSVNSRKISDSSQNTTFIIQLMKLLSGIGDPNRKYDHKTAV